MQMRPGRIAAAPGPRNRLSPQHLLPQFHQNRLQMRVRRLECRLMPQHDEVAILAHHARERHNAVRGCQYRRVHRQANIQAGVRAPVAARFAEFRSDARVCNGNRPRVRRHRPRRHRPRRHRRRPGIFVARPCATERETHTQRHHRRAAGMLDSYSHADARRSGPESGIPNPSACANARRHAAPTTQSADRT